MPKKIKGLNWMQDSQASSQTLVKSNVIMQKQHKI